jgi:hypothetical protein
VRIASLSVHNPHTAEYTRPLAVHRFHERRLPEPHLRVGRQRGFHLVLLGFPSGQALVVQVDLVLRQLEMLDVKLFFDHQDVEAELFAVIPAGDVDGQLMSARFVLQIQSQECDETMRLRSPRFREEGHPPAEERALDLGHSFVAGDFDHHDLALLAAVLAVDALGKRKGARKQVHREYAGEQHDTHEDDSMYR